MVYKDLVVLLDAEPASRGRIELAAIIAYHSGAHLVGLYAELRSSFLAGSAISIPHCSSALTGGRDRVTRVCTRNACHFRGYCYPEIAQFLAGLGIDSISVNAANLLRTFTAVHEAEQQMATAGSIAAK